MALEKAMIQRLDSKGNPDGPAVSVLFNPSEYSIEQSNQFQTTAIPGLSVPATQFVSGNARTLTMDLLFDSYEQKEDVRVYTGKVTSLLDFGSGRNAPPVCKFIWGKLEFKAVLERATQRFTMFLGSGIPVRATLSVTFKEYKTITEQLQEKKPDLADEAKELTAKAGDALWALAEEAYGDPGKWRDIATANRIANPLKLRAGAKLKVPRLGG
ncbi:MAG: CIS tube protein [Bacillota bacterium]